MKNDFYTISILMMADYSKAYGKGIELESFFKSSVKLGNKTLVICRDLILDDKNLITKRWLLKNFIKSLNLLNFFKFNNTRYLQEVIFDYISSFLIPESKILITTPGMHRSIMKAKRNGTTIICHATMAPPEYTIGLLKNLKLDTPYLFSIKYLNWCINNNFDYYLCHSKSAYFKYKNNGYRNILYYEPDVKTKRIKNIFNKKNTYRFLYVGNITELKGCYDLLRWWKNFNFPNIELHLVGDVHNDLKFFLDEILDTNKNIFYWGYDDPLKFYKDCDFFIFLSKSEGGSRALYESINYGLIPIVTNYYANTNIGKCSLIINNKDDLKKILELIRKKGIPSSYGKNYLNFNWNNATDYFMRKINDEILYKR
jgi:glycosyltransferase involved in cell wall biosynthesis